MKESLHQWLSPVVPGPLHGPLPNDGDGWNSIDFIGVWDCGLLSDVTDWQSSEENLPQWTCQYE